MSLTPAFINHKQHMMRDATTCLIKELFGNAYEIENGTSKSVNQYYTSVCAEYRNEKQHYRHYHTLFHIVYLDDEILSYTYYRSKSGCTIRHGTLRINYADPDYVKSLTEFVKDAHDFYKQHH